MTGQSQVMKSVENTQVKTSIIVPAYNEERGLPLVLEKLYQTVDSSYEVIVVNDGSKDATGSAAGAFPCRVIEHGVNQGKGAAMQTGLQHTRGENIIFIDADGTYPVSVIPAMVELLESHDMVVGSRSRGRSNMPLLNRLGNWLFSTLMHFLHGTKTCDPLSGLYGIKKQYLDKMHLRSRNFAIETEISIKAARLGLNVTEIQVDYLPRHGQQKLSALRDGWRILKVILGEMLNRRQS